MICTYLMRAHILCHCTCFALHLLTRSVWDKFNCHFLKLMFVSWVVSLGPVMCLLFLCCLLLNIFSLVPYPRSGIHTASIRSVAKTPILIDRSNKWSKRCDAVTGKMCWRLKERVMSSLQKERVWTVGKREERHRSWFCRI